MPNSEKRKLLDQPQEVINRWIAIKFIRTLRPKFERVSRVYLRIKLTLSERKRLKALRYTLDTFVEESRRVQKTEFNSIKQIFNIALFFLLAERDIQAVKIDALTHPDPWKRNLCLRVILLTMHEWDMSKVAPANKMNMIYENAGISRELRTKMSLALRQMNKAQSRAKKMLANIRHSTIAHRDANALEQYRTIVNLDTIKTMKILTPFYEAVELYNEAFLQLMNESSRPAALLKQYSKNA